MPNPAAVIIGAGDATGGAIARAFAAEGLIACVNRRTRNADQLEALAPSIRDEGHQAHAFPAAARDEEALIALFDREIGRGSRREREGQYVSISAVSTYVNNTTTHKITESHII